MKGIYINMILLMNQSSALLFRLRLICIMQLLLNIILIYHWMQLEILNKLLLKWKDV